MRKNSTIQSFGFSLVELSIVLVIMGLLVGGVLGGQSLIEAANYRKVGTSMSEYQVAFNAFKLKYNCIPGDCSNMASYFPSTSNGDGDGKVIYQWGLGDPFLFWQHLALAGLIPGTYTGVVGGTGATTTVGGVNVPFFPYLNSSNIIGAGKMNTGLVGGALPVTTSHLLMTGRHTDNVPYPDTCGSGNGGCLLSSQVMRVDQKFDDGMPGSGRYMMDGLTSGACLGAGNVYLVTETSGYTYCSIAFKLD